MIQRDEAVMSREFVSSAKFGSQARRYSFIVMPLGEQDIRFNCLELPQVIAVHNNVSVAYQDALARVSTTIEAISDAGGFPPTPLADQEAEASGPRRGDQVNIRLTTPERRLIESVARSRGFGSVSEFLRHAALRDATGQPSQASAKPKIELTSYSTDLSLSPRGKALPAQA